MNEFVKKLTPDYLDDVLIRLAHHSSAMEGNTITLPETATIILDQTLPNNSKITRREYFEVVNYPPLIDLTVCLKWGLLDLSLLLLANEN